MCRIPSGKREVMIQARRARKAVAVAEKDNSGSARQRTVVEVTLEQLEAEQVRVPSRQAWDENDPDPSLRILGDA